MRRAILTCLPALLPGLGWAQAIHFEQASIPVSGGGTVAALGTELAPALGAANWTCGAGWDCSVSGVLNKNADGVGTACQNPTFVPVVGTTYQIVITMGAKTAGNGATWTLESGIYGSQGAIDSVGTHTFYATARGTGNSCIEPNATTDRFTITGVSIKALTDSTGDLVIDGNLTVKSPMTLYGAIDGGPFVFNVNRDVAINPDTISYIGGTTNIWPNFMIYANYPLNPGLNRPFFRLDSNGGAFFSDYVQVHGAYHVSGDMDNQSLAVTDDLTGIGVTIKAVNSSYHHDLLALYNYQSHSSGRIFGTTALRVDALGGLSFGLIADAVVQVGQTVSPSAGTDGRFDVTAGSATTSIGVFGGTRGVWDVPIANGPSTQGVAGLVVYAGLAYVAPAEGQAVTRGHHLIQSSTAGYCDDSAAVTTDGLNIGKALYSEPITYNIDSGGCTGGLGCINTALNTPSPGPAGQITLDTDVAAAGWKVDDPVIYWNAGGATATGLTDGGVYWLLSVSTTKVTISATKTGAVVVPTGQGNTAQYLQRLPIAAVSIQ